MINLLSDRLSQQKVICNNGSNGNLGQNYKIPQWGLGWSHSRKYIYTLETASGDIITSAKEVMFLPVFVCLSVCLLGR